MCYLIAKDTKKHGCFGKHLVQMKKELNAVVAQKGVQLVTISRPTAYGEYAPYQFASSEEEFRKKVIAM